MSSAYFRQEGDASSENVPAFFFSFSSLWIISSNGLLSGYSLKKNISRILQDQAVSLEQAGIRL